MRKYLALVLALVMAFSMFALSAAAEEPIKLVIVQQYGSDARDALIQQMVTDAGYNYELEFIDAPDNMSEQILMMYNSGQQLDMLMDMGCIDTNMIKTGVVISLADRCAEWEDYEKLDKGVMDVITSLDGNPYAIPIEKYQRILFYRTDWLAEAGYDHAPATWEELYEMSAKIHEMDPSRYGYSFRGGSGTMGMFEQAMAGAMDPALINLTGIWVTNEGYCVADDRYAESFDKALEEYKWQYENISPADSITWGYPEMVEGFYSGTTAFLIQTAEVIATCSEYMEEGTWDTAMMPVSANGASYSPVNEGGLGIVSTSKYQDEVWNVIKTVAGYEGSKQYALFYGTTPLYAYEEFGSHYYDAYSEMLLHPDTQIGYQSVYPNCTDEEFEYMADYGFNGDLIIQQYVTGQITAEDVRAECMGYYGWIEDSEWVKSLRAD